MDTTQAYPELGFMILGGHVPDPRPALAELVAGERLGLGSVWISERPGTKDIGVLCGMAVAAAPRLAVGTALINNLPIRNPLTVASLGSTLALLLGNRFVLGVGRGQDRLADMLGAPHSTLSLLGRYIDTLRRLWRGETVSAAHDGWRLEGANLGVRLDPPPPIYLGAVGDVTLAWAGRHCDGVILFSCLNAAAVAHSVDVVRRAAAAGGRDPAAVTIWGVAVTACEVSEDKYLDYVVRRLNTYFMLPVIERICTLNGWDPVIARRIREAIVEQARQSRGAIGDEGVTRELDALRRFRDLYPRAWLDECHATGDRSQAATYLRALFDAGVDRVMIHGSPASELAPLIAAWPAHRGPR